MNDVSKLFYKETSKHFKADVNKSQRCMSKKGWNICKLSKEIL